MRSVAATVAAAVAIGLGATAAGCDRTGSATADLGVTTPPASAPPSVSSLAPTATVAPAPSASPSVTSPVPLPPPDGTPLQAYLGLVAGWQQARSVFFTAVTSGRPLSLAQQHALAAAYLRAERVFSAGVRVRRWPPAAAAAVRGLLAANARQQAHLVAMTQARSATGFTERLADYGVDAGRENRAVAALQRALGG